MNTKQFFLGALACAAVILGLSAAFVVWMDPTLSKGLGEDGAALFSNERYEMAGLIRRQDYSAVVMGTSLVANYRASWFTQGLGEKTLKITFPDGWVSEFDAALRLAFRTHPGLDTVYFGLDPNIMIRPDSQRTVKLPDYLYNDNLLDDVELYLNAGAMGMAFKTLLARRTETAVGLDEAYTWDGQIWFARETALAGYIRPEESGTVLPADAYLDVADENLDVVCRWVEEHPDVRFVVWFPPYSILYWDLRTREGASEAVITAVEHAARRLLAYDNVEVACFLDAYDVITNLDNYADHVHCSGQVTAWAAQNLMEGGWRLTEENCRERLDALRRFAQDYDYEAIFAS